MTGSGAVSTLFRLHDRKGDAVHEADVSAECAPTEEDARLPRADEDEGRAEGPQATAREGAETAERVGGRFPRTERLTNGAEFQALFQQGKRIDRSCLVVLWRPAGHGRRAGFAVSRQLGTAVQRNRARRRIREAYRATRTAAPAGVDLVVIAKRRALTQRFAALSDELREALASIPRSGE